MTKYLLAIDQGTTSTRTMVLSHLGKPLAEAQKEFSQFYPRPGWVEHDPEEIWKLTYQCCQLALQKSKLTAAQITAIGITNQRETTVIWNKLTGKPIYPAIVWQDRRTATLCESLKKKPLAHKIPEKTGLLIDPYLSATKIKWVLENVPSAKLQAANGELLFGTMDCFLLWKLTGGKAHATDSTNASRTLLYNLKTNDWDEELLNFFEIPKKLLPTIKDNCAEFGVTHHSLFDCETPITAMIGDQQAALIGQQCFSPNMIKSTYGTGCFLLMNTGKKIIQSKHKLLSTVVYRLKGESTYGLEGSIFNAGTTVKWLRDNLHIIKESKDIEKLAASVDSTEGVYFVSAFTGLGAPYWDPEAKAAILGLTRNTQVEHIARAALETVCYRTHDLLGAMEKDTSEKVSHIRVDGGMAQNSWMLQWLANITNVEIERPHCVELSVVGAGLLAALGAGLFKTLSELSDCWKLEKRFSPALDNEKRNTLLNAWSTAVSRIRTN